MTSWTFQTGGLSSPGNRFRTSVVRALAMAVRRIENRLHPSKRTSKKPEVDRTSRDDDTLLFRQHVGDARPLKHGREHPDPGRRPARRDRPAPATESGGAPEGGLDPDPGGDVERGSRIEFSRPGLQRREMRRLRRGQPPVQDQLDLHGLRASEAERAVLEFIDRSRARGLRCVCIVHGKGQNSPKQRPVLKAIVDQWLRRCHAVLAFSTAPDHAGGTGAVRVLLRA